MDPGIIASLLIAIIGAYAGISSQRSAAKALTKNTQISSRVEMEKEAYARARKLDVETIERQEEEITQLREENNKLRLVIIDLQARVIMLENPKP